MAELFSAAYVGPGVGGLCPESSVTLVSGAYWDVLVPFVNPQNGQPLDLTYTIPKARLYPSWGGQPISLEINDPSDTDPPNLVRFGLNTEPSTGGVNLPSTGFRRSFLNLIVSLADESDEREVIMASQTISVAGPGDPNMAASESSSSAQVIAYGGPRGPRGIPGVQASQSDINAAVISLLPQAVSDYLTGVGLPRTAAELQALVDDRARQIVEESSASPVNPTLGALTLSSLSPVAGTPFTATIYGKTAGSTVTAASSDGTSVNVSSGSISGTFQYAGTKQITLTETLAGAVGSPKTTTLSVAVSAAAPTLVTLTLDKGTASTTTPFSANVVGATPGSQVAATSSDGTALTVTNGVVTGQFSQVGAVTVTLTEMLSGATNGPKTSAVTVVISANQVLGNLSLSQTSAIVGSVFSATIQGQTPGSTITASSSDGTALTVSGSTLTGTFQGAGSPTVTLIETLAGAANSPQPNTIVLQVGVDLTNPANTILLHNL